MKWNSEGGWCSKGGAGIPACGWPVAQAGMPVSPCKYLVLLLAGLLLASSAASAQTGSPRGVTVRAAVEAGFQGDYDPARMHAIVIGVDAYRHWPKLRCAVNDARAVANTLYRHYGFPTNQINLLLDGQATRRGILRALDGALALRDPDNLLIYYAGHGWQDQAQNGFWVPVDAEEGNKFDYISNNEIVGDYFKKYGVKHLLVVVDSCFSGAMLRGSMLERPANWRLPAGFQKPSRLVLTSGDLQPVPDGTSGNSPFALRFLQHLRYADQPAYGVQDLHVFIRRNLNTESICAPLDTPRHMPGGELILCRLETPLQPENVFLDFGPGGTAVVRQPPAREPVRKGGLFVETTPAGALVKAGGHDIQRSPFTFRNLPAGPLTVTVDLADHDTETRQVTIPADDFATLTLALKRQQGRISVESDPPRAEIWIGGQKAGETPRTLTLDVGTVALTLKRDGYEDRTVSVQVRAGQTASTGAVALEKPRFPDVRSAWENSLGMKFAPVAGLDGVLFGVWETRVQDFREFVNDRARNSNYDYRKGEEPYVLKSDGWKQRGWEFGWSNPGFPQADTHPVTCVSWEDAQAFCEWLTRKERAEGKIAANQAYRLPRDWEWSVAVGLNESRSGTPKDKNAKTADVYPWGSGEKPPARWGNYAGEEAKNSDWPSNFGVISGYRDEHARTSPAGHYGAKHGALCDLGGNVWEWCEDFYDGQSGARVLRGGSWYSNYPGSLLSSFRVSTLPGGRSVNFGFRVVLGVSSR